MLDNWVMVNEDKFISEVTVGTHDHNVGWFWTLHLLKRNPQDQKKKNPQVVLRIKKKKKSPSSIAICS